MICFSPPLQREDASLLGMLNGWLLQDEPAEICILGEITDVLLHIRGIDFFRLAGMVGSGEGHLV